MQAFVVVHTAFSDGGKQAGAGSMRHTDLLPGFVDGEGSVTTMDADLPVQLCQIRCLAANHAQLCCTGQVTYISH